MPQAVNIPEFWLCRHIVNITNINVTNVIILEFLSARFVNQGAPQITILYFFNIDTNKNIRITKANKLFFLATMISEL